MKNKTLNLVVIRHFLYVVLVVVFISCQESSKHEVKTIIISANDTISIKKENSKIYSIEEIANMKIGEMIYIEIAGDIRIAKVLENDIKKQLIWYKRANYYADIDDLSIVEIKKWCELP